MLARDPPENTGQGTRVLYSRYSATQAAVDFLTAWKWPIIAGLLGLAGLLAFGVIDVPEIPPEGVTLVYYVSLGSLISTPIAYLLLRYFRNVSGTELWDMDPVTGRHRHLRIGSQMWDDLVILSPWGTRAGVDELERCSINGRQGFEVMDFRVTPDGTPVAVATWIGESSGAEFRTYKKAFAYAYNRLSRRADRATMLRANQGEIAREAAERVVTELVRTHERSTVPNGEEIQGVVSDVLDDFGLGNPLDDDLEDDLGESTSDQARSNGHDVDEEILDLLGGVTDE